MNYNNNPDQTLKYENFLISEIRIHNLPLPIPLTIEGICTVLKDQLIMERLIGKLEVETRRDINQDSGIFRLMYTVPCLLHAEIRIYIKVIELLLIEGLANCTTKQTYVDENNRNKQHKLFMKNLYNIINKMILGTGAEEMSAPWSLLLEGTPNKEEIGNISFNKNRARKIVESMENLLITVCDQFVWYPTVNYNGKSWCNM